MRHTQNINRTNICFNQNEKNKQTANVILVTNICINLSVCVCVCAFVHLFIYYYDKQEKYVVVSVGRVLINI